MVNYETATPDEIASHFATITRQRVQQLMSKFEARHDTDVVEKIRQAKRILKASKYKAKNNGYTPEQIRRARDIWLGMKQRVGKVRAYLDCEIEWKSESEFRDWMYRQVGSMVENFELDKDVLVKGNRIYGSDTCAFVPQEINMLFSGCYKAARRGQYPIGVSFNKGSGHFVAQMSDRQENGLDKYLGSFPTVEEAFACYKIAKEAKIKRLADKWKDQIDPRVYEALLRRTVEWED